jgi:hypothetical protein
MCRNEDAIMSIRVSTVSQVEYIFYPAQLAKNIIDAISAIRETSPIDRTSYPRIGRNNELYLEELFADPQGTDTYFVAVQPLDLRESTEVCSVDDFGGLELIAAVVFSQVDMKTLYS